MRRPFGSFAGAVTLLRRACPAALPVSVRRVRMPPSGDACADTTLSIPRRRFLIRVDAGLPEDAAVLVLTHEWAHVLAWGMEGGASEIRHDHDAFWGVAYARVWRAFVEAANGP